MKLYRFVAVVVTISCMVMWSPPAWAISIKEEKKLGSEFLKYVRRHYQLVDDPMISAYVSDIGQRILSVMPPQPFNYQFHIVKESVYNAFAIPAGHVFINSGLLAAMESEDELAGILAMRSRMSQAGISPTESSDPKKSIWLLWRVWPQLFFSEPLQGTQAQLRR